MSKHNKLHPNTQQALARASEMQASRQQQAGAGEALRAATVAAEAAIEDAHAPPAPPSLAAVPPEPKPVTKMTVTERGVEYENPLIVLGIYVHLPVTVNAQREGIPNPGGREEQVNKIRPARALVANGAIVIEEMTMTLPLAGNYVRS